jgi:hypothetical protein
LKVGRKGLGIVRISWLEAICVVAIGVATLQLPVGDRSARLFTPPAVTLSMLKEMVVANSASAGRHAAETGNEGKH